VAISSSIRRFIVAATSDGGLPVKPPRAAGISAMFCSGTAPENSPASRAVSSAEVTPWPETSIAKQADAVAADREEAHQIAADMARGAQQQRDPRRPETAVALAHQRLLQLARLHEVAVERVMHRLQPGQRVADEPVLFLQLALHPQDALAGGDAGAQLVGVDRLGQEVVGALPRPWATASFSVFEVSRMK
jgi:hypothetical protein